MGGELDRTSDEGAGDAPDGAGISRRRLLGTAAIGAAGAALPGAVGPADADAKRRRRKADVAIVGAGFAGLTAALELVRRGKSVVVLEARNRVGGRVHNHPIGGGEISERGGTFTGPTQDRLMAMARRFKVKTFPTYVDGENVYVNSLGIRSTYSDTAPTGTAPPDPLILPDLATVVTRLNQMAAEIDVNRPWASPDARARDSQTFQSWLEDNSVAPQFREIAAVATRPIFGAEPRELSLLYVLFYIAASGNEQNVGTFERNFNTRNGAQMFRFVGGTGLICERMAKRLGRRIVKRAPVQRIHQNRRGVTVVARGITVEAKRVIVAIPPPLAARIECTPALPVARDSLTQRVSQGTLMKATAVYDEPFWRADGLNGTVVSHEGPMQVTYDASPPDGSPGVIFGFVGGDLARRFRTMPRAKRRAAVIANLTTYFGSRAARPRKYFESDWPGEVYSRGGPVGYTAPGALSEYGPALRRPFGRIHWAGTETSGYWVGYMDGAIRSGERVADEVLKRL